MKTSVCGYSQTDDPVRAWKSMRCPAPAHYIEQHGDIVDKFVRAMEKSLAYTAAHPEAARKAVLTYTKIPEAAAENMKLPKWNPEYNDASIEKTIELAHKYGFVDESVALDDLIRR
jgi:NitT/TauT family transport system substrate-binding protein